jgi:hypothetical protein
VWVALSKASRVGFVRGKWTPRPIGFVRGMTVRPLERSFPHTCVQNACWVRSGALGPAAGSASFGGAFALVFTGYGLPMAPISPLGSFRRSLAWARSRYRLPLGSFRLRASVVSNSAGSPDPHWVRFVGWSHEHASVTDGHWVRFTIPAPGSFGTGPGGAIGFVRGKPASSSFEKPAGAAIGRNGAPSRVSGCQSAGGAVGPHQNHHRPGSRPDSGALEDFDGACVGRSRRAPRSSAGAAQSPAWGTTRHVISRRVTSR